MTQSEHRRDAGVTFENAESVRQAESHARRDEARPSGEHSRDAGVVFGTTESRPRRDEGAVPGQAKPGRETGASFETAVRASAAEEVPPIPGERSHDAGVVFENTEGREQPERSAEKKDGSLSGLLYSMAGLGGAATRFTVDQMKTAARMMTDPLHVLGHLQNSMDKVSTALQESVEPSAKGERRS